MEDLLLEMKDHEEAKEQIKEAKKNIEASLVAGGKLLRDKDAHQILGETAVAVGGVEPKLASL
jgi:glycerol-3-phosphate responsive antiterminator